MNIHHLELFYYVAKHGGISEAVRRFPYGIQQPAVSSQIIQLEQYLGVTLFRRRPFQLTAAGAELYRFIQPFFGGLSDLAAKLQGGRAHHLRIGASEIVLREHLPTLLQRVRRKCPGLRCTLREGYQPQTVAWLEHDEIDVALTLLDGPTPTGFQSRPLLRLPLVLLVPQRSRLRSAEQLWRRDRIDEALITLSAYEAVCRTFEKELARRGLDWFPSIEVSSLNLIEIYVARGFGIGLFLEVPRMRLSPGVRMLPLPDFAPVVFGALWRGTPSPLVQAVLDLVEERARQLSKATALAGHAPPPGGLIEKTA